MPTNVVRNKKDESRWSECKKSVRKSHPDLSTDDDRFYALVMGCFQRRKKASAVGGAAKAKRK